MGTKMNEWSYKSEWDVGGVPNSFNRIGILDCNVSNYCRGNPLLNTSEFKRIFPTNVPST